MTYCVGCKSSDTWGCARFCVALERVVYDDVLFLLYGFTLALY